METAIVRSEASEVYRPDYRTVTVYGECMIPKFNPGQMIRIYLVEKYHVIFGKAYLIEFSNDHIFIQYIKRGKDVNHWILASENPNYQEREFRTGKIRNIFEISGIITICQM